MWAHVLLWENKGCVGYSWGKVCACILSHFSRVQLCDPMDYNSLPGSFAHGILQARILEWVAIPFSRDLFQPRDWTRISLCLLHWQEGSLPLAPLGKVCWLKCWPTLPGERWCWSNMKNDGRERSNGKYRGWNGIILWRHCWWQFWRDLNLLLFILRAVE